MSRNTESYHFLIVGGGIFGIYAALYLAGRGLRIALVEKENALLRKASIVNQARLHSGYHYPRSVATAIMSDENKARFTAEHQPFINSTFEKYYAIDRFGSLTDAAQFERFCDFINIPWRRVSDHPLFDYHRIEALYATVEHSFDPILIAQYYERKVTDAQGIDVLMMHTVAAAEADGDAWRVRLHNLADQTKRTVQATQVINATYAGSNAINRLFGARDIDLQHEISEMVFVTSPQVRQIGLTVMDGQFGSIMPYGLSDVLSLSAVAYTHHKVSYDNLPTFDCQEKVSNCTPDLLSICNYCPARPPSNYRKMINLISHYFADGIRFDYFFSMFTVKSKLKASYIDDGRPTEISILHDRPRFYCIFAGKINSIYEIEKVVDV